MEASADGCLHAPCTTGTMWRCPTCLSGTWPASVSRSSPRCQGVPAATSASGSSSASRRRTSTRASTTSASEVTWTRRAACVATMSGRCCAPTGGSREACWPRPSSSTPCSGCARRSSAVATARGPMRRRRARDASRPADCPVCREAASVVDGALRHLVRSTEDPRWAEAVAGMEICLEHLVTMMAAPGRPSGWAAVERRQLERVAAIRSRLIAHADHSAHDRRHLATREDRTRWTRRLGSWAVVAGRSAEAATLRSTRSVRRCGSRP